MHTLELPIEVRQYGELKKGVLQSLPGSEMEFSLTVDLNVIDSFVSTNQLGTSQIEILENLLKSIEVIW